MMPLRPFKTGKRWRIPLDEIPFCPQTAMGNGTQWRFHIQRNGNHDWFAIAIEGKGAYTFASYATPGYLAEKLGLPTNFNDYLNVTDIVNSLLGQDMKEYGRYQDDLFEDEPEHPQHPEEFPR